MIVSGDFRSEFRWLLDAGVPLETQLKAMALYCFLSAAWMIALIPKLDTLASA